MYSSVIIIGVPFYTIHQIIMFVNFCFIMPDIKTEHKIKYRVVKDQKAYLSTMDTCFTSLHHSGDH